MKELEAYSFAKINLGLFITGIRPDGYHELVSIFQKISLHDTIRIRYPVSRDIIRFSGRYAERIPENDNTLTRALNLVRKWIPDLPPMEILVEKRIPTGAGLGGGSSNAGTLIQTLLAEFGLQELQPAIQQDSLAIGADVPFFLGPDTALVQGIGEQIQAVHLPNNYYVTVFYPCIHLSTSEVYKNYDLRLTGVRKNVIFYPLLGKLCSIRDFPELLLNDLEPVAIEMVKELRDLKEWMVRQGFDYVQMSGSGSAFFGLSEKRLFVHPPENVRAYFCKPL